MKSLPSGWKYSIGLIVSILLLFAANLWVGSVRIPAGAVWDFVRTCRRTGELAVHFAGIAYSARDNCFAVWSSLGCLGVDVANRFQ